MTKAEAKTLIEKAKTNVGSVPPAQLIEAIKTLSAINEPS